MLQFAAATALVALAEAGVIQLDKGNFDSTIKKGNVLVKFYAPWYAFLNTMV